MEYNAIQTDRVETWAHTLLGIRGGGVMPTVTPELACTLNFPTYLDTDLPAGYRRWGGGMAVGAGGAGTYAAVACANYTSTRVLAVRWSGYAVGAAGNIYFLTAETLNQLAGGGWASTDFSWHDLRMNRASLPMNVSGIALSYGTPAVAPPALGIAAVTAGLRRAQAEQTVDGPWLIVPPGRTVLMALGTANASLGVNIEAWIREMLPDELASL